MGGIGGGIERCSTELVAFGALVVRRLEMVQALARTAEVVVTSFARPYEKNTGRV